ncbi:hypothetical protein HMPREF0201_01507 [Cedecea davisae DSM 4568]|uniref:Uncharacterized protein n=1 Tax=Cedecea davisae DSM 4568 TaxID=566551 RepID=S3J024_9ENTR|nr:hypothetical protein HMPREF0201_01507 [Cedecea davisae DSM 4568]
MTAIAGSSNHSIVAFFGAEPKLAVAECLIFHRLLLFLTMGEQNVA